jgi:hypothetical protein
VRYDGRDYVTETKLRVQELVASEFEGAAVYLADLDNIPTFGAGGTFCIEALGSAVDVAGALPNVLVTLRVWTYVEAVDAAEAEERVAVLAQKLEAALLAASRPAPAAGAPWLDAEYLATVYMPREKGRAFRRQYLRAGRTDWRVRLAACR